MPCCELKTTETCSALHQFVIHTELLSLPSGKHGHLPKPLIRKKLSSKNRQACLGMAAPGHCSSGFELCVAASVCLAFASSQELSLSARFLFPDCLYFLGQIMQLPQVTAPVYPADKHQPFLTVAKATSPLLTPGLWLYKYIMPLQGWRLHHQIAPCNKELQGWEGSEHATA